MNNNRFLKILSIFIWVSLASCVNDSYHDLVVTDTSINLKWNKAYDNDTVDQSVIGLQWALSYIGAKLPVSENGITVNGDIILINLEKLGFNQNALQKLQLLNDVIKASDEYQQTEAVDLGRYVTLLIGSSEHYYEITGVPMQLSTLLNNYTLLPERGFINNSGVSFEHRIVSFSAQNGFNQLFFCAEIDPLTQEILEYETVEILDNGQLRFGIFDLNGNRKNSTDPSHSNAGKPAKCMWCHESGIQPLFDVQDNFDGFIPYLDFRDQLTSFRNSHIEKKNALIDGVDFTQTQQHTLTELLYISFMEPSAERLSLEWEMTLSEVLGKLAGLQTHTHDEFPFLGDLYHRAELEAFAPFNGLQVSSSVREQSDVEVNHIN